MMALHLPSVVTITPSRGLIHSRTIEAVLAAHRYAVPTWARLAGWLFSHDLPIPMCHETLAEQGMATGADFLWIVEEDVLPSVPTLALLVKRHRETGAGIVLVDYPVGEHPTRSSIMRQPDDGAILYGGIGCALIAREALLRIPQPWFSTAHEIRQQRDAVGRWHLYETEGAYTYGGLDVAFCRKATAHGISIAAVEDTLAGHARLRALGTPHHNNGCHLIDVLTRIEA
jgi:hypothetical protein